MKSPREKAKETAHAIRKRCTYPTSFGVNCVDDSRLEDAITEALEAAYKLGTMARIELSDKDIKYAVNDYVDGYLPCWAIKEWTEEDTKWLLIKMLQLKDNLKITPLTSDELLPSDKTVRNWIVPQNGDRDYERLQFMQYVRDFVAEKLERK